MIPTILFILAMLFGSQAGHAQQPTHYFGDLHDIGFVRANQGDQFIRKKITCDLRDQNTDALIGRFTTDQIITGTTDETILLPALSNADLLESECAQSDSNHSPILGSIQFFDANIGEAFNSNLNGRLNQNSLFCQCHPTFVDSELAGRCLRVGPQGWEPLFMFDARPGERGNETRISFEEGNFDETFQLKNCTINGDLIDDFMFELANVQ